MHYMITFNDHNNGCPMHDLPIKTLMDLAIDCTSNLMDVMHVESL